MKEFRNPVPPRRFGLAFGLLAASVVCLLSGALVAGSLQGALSLGVAGAGFAAYVLLFARALHASGADPRPGVHGDAPL